MSCSSLDMEKFAATKSHVAQNPEDGKGSFEAVTEWQDGAQAITRARSFVIQTDEPAPLGGTDTAIDPMELLLGALGSCLTIGWVTQANLRGVDFRNLKITVTAPFDLRGYLALDAHVRPGFGDLQYTVEVDSDADDAVLEEIKAATEATSPMFDNILRPTGVSGRISRVGAEAVA
jgi:uncharacterized OsmC-like protein